MKILSTPLKTEIQRLAEGTRQEFLLASPWIRKDALEIITNKFSDDYLKNVITKGNLEDYLSGSSDISAIKFLLDHNCEVRLASDLHAKLYISDETKAIVTSANCTLSGMQKNAEIGVLIEDEKTVRELVEIFRQWHERGKVIDQGWLESMITMIDNNAKVFKEAKSQMRESSKTKEELVGYRIIRSSADNLSQYTDVSGKKYDWREAIRTWEHAARHTRYVEDWIRFFETVFRKLPEKTRVKAWFGVHKSYISLSVGNMWIASISVETKLKQVKLIVDTDWDGGFKSTTDYPLGLKYFKWDDIAHDSIDSENWNSFSRALEKIWYSSHSKIYRQDFMARKQCVSTFFNESTGDLL